ncbi:MAG TPA: hypothetical protein VI911_02425 [Patescibacteria group bacterium]|nr:hypothetical protein [Patescibacteria group bacterium]
MTKISQIVDEVIKIITRKGAKDKIAAVDATLNQITEIKKLWSTATVEKARTLYLEGSHANLAIVLPHLRDALDEFIQRLMLSRILLIGESYDKAVPLTFGADPEFILENEQGEIVLFSSNMCQGNIVMSEAAIGADYGLMEFRPQYSETIPSFIANLDTLQANFVKNFTKLRIKRSEAEVFDHKKMRILEQLEDAHVDHGVQIAKGFFVEQNLDLDDESSYAKISISAYDEPLFGSNRKDILSAGGHIHIGGTFIKMLSLPQMKEFVRRIDTLVKPMCAAIETPAAALRREVYGFPGEFRIKPYGLEYRSPSNAIFWPENREVLKNILTVIKGEAESFFIK